jgi:hypothetical protein
MCFVAILEGVNQIAADIIIDKRCPGDVELMTGGAAYSAGMIFTSTYKWYPANRAEWSGNYRKLFTAGRTDVEWASFRNKTTADMTQWREEKIKRRLQK